MAPVLPPVSVGGPAVDWLLIVGLVLLVVAVALELGGIFYDD